MTTNATEIEWVTVDRDFGAAMPHGSCNARSGDTVCGYPRHADGTCSNGHPAQEEQRA